VTSPGKKRVLFVCIGNACRSQMAEAFAMHYGNDVLIAASAGLAPASAVHPVTVDVMHEKNIDLADHFPKAVRHLGRAEFDLIVNMSGSYIPKPPPGRIIDWEVDDPVYMDREEHCQVRDEIERRVMALILELRAEPQTRFRGQGSGSR
jgi:arsenate reductase